jgi:hypothetical protein
VSPDRGDDGNAGPQLAGTGALDAVAEAEFIDADGTVRREPLSLCWNVAFERVRPVRDFPSFRGQRNRPGLWWFATTGEHVGHESWLERERLMALDADPGVVAVAAQPMWLHWNARPGLLTRIPRTPASRRHQPAAACQPAADQLRQGRPATA